MKSFIFSKEHRGAYLCPTFIEGGALSSNTVLIAFEGFNLFSIFFFTNLYYIYGLHYIFGQLLHLWLQNTHILNFNMILRFGRSE